MRWIVINDEYGDAVVKLSKKKKQKIGAYLESLLDTIPEVVLEINKRRVKKL